MEREHILEKKECLYIGMGSKEVSFKSLTEIIQQNSILTARRLILPTPLLRFQ